MSFSKLVEVKNNFKFNPNNSCKNLYKGACVKIKNSQKTFQVVGINPESKVCWIREWPFALEVNKTCLLYTTPSPRDSFRSRMPSSA